jgi:hypothetical protein
VKGRRADRKLHLELLRARAAADRIELSLAMQDVSDRLTPLRRAADAVGSVAAVLGGRGRALTWVVGAVAALARSRRARRAVAAAASGLGSAVVPPMRVLALGALAAGAVALLIRRRRGSGEEDPSPRAARNDREPGAG